MLNSVIKLSALVLMVFLVSCNTAQKSENDQSNKAQESTSMEHTYTVIVDAIARTKTPGASFNYKDLNEEKNLRARVDLEPLTLGLKKESYRPLEEGKKGEIEIQVKFKLEKPITGIAIFGNITPFIHTMTVRAFKNSKPAWETEVTAKSEYEDVRVVLPLMVAAAQGYFGSTTQGKKEVQIQQSNKRVRELTPTGNPSETK